jgi:hypothetical protein
VDAVVVVKFTSLFMKLSTILVQQFKYIMEISGGRFLKYQCHMFAASHGMQVAEKITSN